MRVLPILLLISCLAPADVETLLDRAKTRLAHGNEEGARELYERALAEDPSCGPALAWLASKEERYDGISLHLRYLTEAKPLDAETASRLLRELGDRVADPPQELLQWAERSAMTTTAPQDEPCGPWRPWQRATRVPTMEAAGPLVTEAMPSALHTCRETLLRIADRLDREHVASAAAKVELAVCLHAVGEQGAAEDLIARAAPSTLEDRIEVARCAFLVLADPGGWWNAHGEALLAAMVCADPPGADPPGEREVLASAYALLAERRDLPGVVALAPAIASCAPPEFQWWRIEGLAESICRDWHGEEAAAAMEDDRSSPVRCLGASILYQTGQLDRALGLLEALVREDPDNLLARECLAAWYPPGTLERARAELDEEAVARRLRPPPGSSASAAALTSATMLNGDAAAIARARQLLREDPKRLYWCARDWRGRADVSILVDDLLDAARRLSARKAGLDRSDTSALLGVLLEQGRTEGALWLVESTPGSSWRERLEPRNPSFRWEEFYAEMKPLLALIASQPRPRETVDEFLRLFPNIEPSRQAPFTVWRLREDLLLDDSFRRLPSADYLLSCLYDPAIDSEKVQDLRRSAFRAGCRSRALLIDLLGEGEAVLHELESVDPIAARLERAKRSAGPEALEAFLESDDASEEQFREAGWALRSRRPPMSHEDPSESSRTPSLRQFELQSSDEQADDLPRLVWAVLQTAPPSQWTLQEIRWKSKLLPPAVAAALKDRDPRTERPSEAFFRTLPSAADLAIRRPSYSDDWYKAEEHVFETEGKEGIRKLFAGPYGRGIASAGNRAKRWLSTEDMIDLVREQARVHPLDLGWLDLEEPLVKEGEEHEARRKDIALARMAASMRGPERMVRLVPHCASVEEKTALCKRAMAMFEGMPPERVIPLVHDWTGYPMDSSFGQFLMDWATARCKTVEDRLALCDLAERRRQTDEADRLEQEVLRDGPPSTLFQVLQVRRSWERPPMASKGLVERARAGAWTTTQARQVWTAVCMAAVQEKQDDLFSEALTEMWRLAPVDWQGTVNWPASELTWHDERSKDVAMRLLSKENAPLAVLQFALGLGRRHEMGDGLKKAEEGLAVAGYPSSETWLDTLAGLPRASLMERLRTALAHTSTLDGRDLAVLSGVCSRLLKTGRTADIQACADVWGARQTPPEVQSWRATAPTYSIADRWNPGPRLNPLFGCPAPPSGTHRLPALASAAVFLADLSLLDAAGEKIGQAAEEAADPVAREACRFVQAKLCEANHRSAEAMRILLALRDRSTADWLRADAGTMSDDLYRKDASSRAAYVDVFLEDHPSTVVVPEGELRAWETRLCSDDERERRRAGEELTARGEAAIEVLRGLRQSSEPEVRARVEDLLEDLLAP